MSDSKPIGALQDTVYSVVEALAKLRKEFVELAKELRWRKGVEADQRAEISRLQQIIGEQKDKIDELNKRIQ